MATDEYPELRRLVDLGTAGWSFIHHQKEDGSRETVCIDAYFQWPSGPIDCVRIEGPGDAMAIRTTGGMEPRLIWEVTGSVAEVIDRVMELPPPTDPRAPKPRSEHAFRITGVIL